MIQGGQTRTELMNALGLKDRKHFRITYLQPALDAGLLGMSMPDKPSSRLQKYHLTEQGQMLLAQQRQVQ